MAKAMTAAALKMFKLSYIHPPTVVILNPLLKEDYEILEKYPQAVYKMQFSHCNNHLSYKYRSAVVSVFQDFIINSPKI